MDRYKIIRQSDGSISFSGCDMGGRGSLVAENKEVVVVKFASGKHFAGRGCQNYHSPSIYVLRKDKDGWAYPLIKWDVTRNKKQ